VAGEVKTRLTPPLSPEAAASLAEAFLEDAVSICGQVKGATTVLFRAGETDRLSPEWMEDLTCLPQSGGDLGDRMSAAFSRLLAGGGRKALIVGSDCPTVDPDYLRAAFEALSSCDVVLGPTVDGGYYLVGLSTPHPELFEGIPWSTTRVLSETLKRVQDLGLRVTCVTPWYDVDDGDALMFLVRELSAGRPAGPTAAAPATRRALARLGLLES
jgi:rSAM/selenodomain-associated transferase 1